jgi:hypothetical protein
MNPKASAPILLLQLTVIFLFMACSEHSAVKKPSKSTDFSTETTRSFSSESNKEPIQDTVTASSENPIQTVVTKNGRRRNSKLSWKKWQSSFREEVQVFRARADEPIHIVGKRGTEVFFPANSFANAKGKMVLGELELRLKECYDFLAFFADGLTTVTTDGKLIETGGTIRLQAFQNGKELALVSNVEGKVLFPKNGSELPGMQTFYGETTDDNTIVWETDTTIGVNQATTLFNAGKASFTSETSSQPIKMRVDRLRHTDLTTKNDENIRSKEVTWKLRDTSGTLLGWLENQPNYNAEIEDYFFRRNGSLLLKLRFDEEGNIDQIVYGKKTPLPLMKALDKFLKNAPPVAISEMGNYKKSLVYMLGLDGVSDAIAVNEGDDLGTLVKSGVITRADSTYWVTKQLLYYELAVNKMGWINCDRFYQDKRPKINFTVLAPQKTDFMVMQLSNYRSQMLGYKLGNAWRFDYLPEGESFKIIAITVTDNQRHIAVEKGIVDSKYLTIDQGNPMTDKEFAKVIR